MKHTYGDVYLSVVHGENPAEMTMPGGGCHWRNGAVCSTGDDVIIKPNICTDYYTYEYARDHQPGSGGGTGADEPGSRREAGARDG